MAVVDEVDHLLRSLRGVWDEEGWVNHWWPAQLRQRAAAPVAAAAGGA